MRRWSWLFVMFAAGCGATFYDKGSEIYTTGGIYLVYTDWVAPKDSNWQKDSYECQTEAIEAMHTLVRAPGQRQALADRCMMTRGYVRR